MKKLFLALTAIILVSFSSFGQNYTGSDSIAKWSVTLSGGSMLFYGDIRQYGIYPVGKHSYPNISERKGGFGLAVNRKLSPIFSVQAQFQNGKLSGFKRSADAYFNTSFNEYGVNGIINFIKLFFPNMENQNITIYGLLGVGMINFKSIEKSISTDNVISSYGYEINGQKQKRTTEILFPVGLGAKYSINKQLDAGIEIIMNNVNTDKLDACIVPRSAKDKYGYTCVTLTYKIAQSTFAKLFKKKKVAEKDSDGDGVPDKIDKCPNTPAYATVDANGCPFDTDGDGVPDYHDKCPNTPKDVKVDSVGCPIDSDGDHVPDYLDKCPNTPKGAKVDAVGCPVDSDGDGVPDYLDKCPFTPKGTKVDAQGCPIN